MHVFIGPFLLVVLFTEVYKLDCEIKCPSESDSVNYSEATLKYNKLCTLNFSLAEPLSSTDVMVVKFCMCMNVCQKVYSPHVDYFNVYWDAVCHCTG